MNNIARPDCCIELGRSFLVPSVSMAWQVRTVFAIYLRYWLSRSPEKFEKTRYEHVLKGVRNPYCSQRDQIIDCCNEATNFVSLIAASDVIVNKSRLSGCIEYFIYFRLPCSVHIFRFQPYPPNMDSSYPDDDLAYLSSGSSSSDSIDGSDFPTKHLPDPPLQTI
jgi:hypothetical protein